MVTPGSLLDDFPRGDPNRALEALAPPAAFFARTDSVRSAQSLSYINGRVFLGVAGAEIREERRADGSIERHALGGTALGISDDRHMITIAGTRAGKGRSVIVPNMLYYPGSVLATDPKGELARITARCRSEGLRQNVHVLDPFGVAKGAAEAMRKGFNPLKAMRPDSLVEDAALIADALVVVAGNDPHWDESARAFIEGVILHAVTDAGLKDRASLVTVRELIGVGQRGEDGKPSMPVLEGAMRCNPGADGVVQTAAADFFDKPRKEQESVLSTARRHLKFLDLPAIRAVVQGHDFDLADLKREPTTIYLCLPARHIGTCSRWLRLFVNLTLQAMEREDGPPAGGVPLLCCLDEFASLGHMRQIEDAAGQIAGFGVKLWPVLQDIGQLKTLYKDRWETFMGNAGVLQFFGNNDLTTLEWISKRLGKTSIRARRDAALTRDQVGRGGTGESWATEVYDLLGPDEVARFFGRDDPLLRQLIIFAGRRPPVVIQRAYYDKHGLFRGEFDE